MILASCIAIISITIMSLQSAFGLESDIYQNLDGFPYFCAFKIKPFILICMVIYDFGTSISAAILFHIPLGKIQRSRDEAESKQILMFGKKYAGIVLINSVSNV